MKTPREATDAGLSVADLAVRLADWCRRRPLRLAVLFGSRARGDAQPTSDVDLAVWVPELPSPQERLAWRHELATLVEVEAQLVFVTPRLDPVLGMQISREGLALFEIEPGTWIAERVRLWHLFQDSLPFLRAARRQLLELAAEVRDGA